ncbi:peroxisome proliferator-activated receptor gamma coactivator 1-beta [Gastrophryne carolinensis]
MADCSALLDDDLESFVFNYLTDSPEPGDEPLSLDFPEIDLYQLDSGDFDTNSCFNELQWCNDQSENDSSHYSTDDSELFQIIDGDNEALLAALTQTLDDMQEDEISLSDFICTGDGDFYPLPSLSPKPILPAESPKRLETEDELSILKKLLLSPAQKPTSSDHDSSCRKAGATKLRPLRQCLKVESLARNQSSVPQTSSKSCIELQRHLVSGKNAPSSSAKDDSLDSNKEDECESPEEDQSEDESSNSTQLPAPQSQEPQFTCDKEKRAVVDLIRYMHTYCLPPKKHHSEGKPHSTSLLKRPKTGNSLSVHACLKQGAKVNSNTKGNFHVVGHCKRTKPQTESSILKVLLAKDIDGDVSKPYRFAQPVYAAFTCSHVTQGKNVHGLGKGNKSELEATHKPFLPLKKESRCTDADSGRSAHNVFEQTISKSAVKQECSVYAVRRSSRLNPEFWFTEEISSQACTAQAILVAQSLCLTEDPFVDEEQVAEVEVGESMETIEQTEMDRALHDLLEMNGMEACSDIGLYHSLDNTTPTDALSHTLVMDFGLRSVLNSTGLFPVENGFYRNGGAQEDSSSFEKRNFDHGLSVELCGTAGLTPPTTPPYKPTEEDLFKPVISQDAVNNNGSLVTSSIKVEERVSLNRRISKKQPDRTELFAHMRGTSSLIENSPPQGIKRPFSRSFGDHDYCQVKKSEPTFQRRMVKSLSLPDCDDKKQKQMLPLVPERKVEKKTEPKQEDSKVLKDHEIRASLNKHFGSPDHSSKEQVDNVTCTSPEYGSVFEESDSECSSPDDEVYLSPLRTTSYSQRSALSKRQSYSRTQMRGQMNRTPDNRRSHRDLCFVSRYERAEHRQSGHLSQRQIQRRRAKAIDEGRVVVIRNLSNSISASELKRRFEVFGEIMECRILSKSRGDKYGFITYRRSEYAALSLKKGPSLRKRNEPSFHMSYGGFRHLFWTKYRDLDSNADEPSSTVIKSKYESMDFDSLLKEAQRNLHR